MISIETRGTPYERGMQHGSQCADLICTIVSSYRDKGQLGETPLPALRKLEWFFPELIAEMEGIAAGSELPADDIFRLNLQHLDAAPACSVVAIRGENGEPWIAKTDDIGQDELGWNILQRSTNQKGTTSLNLHFAGTVWFSTSYVENGFCMAMTGVPGGIGPRESVTWVSLLPLLPAQCATVEQALNLLREVELEYGGISLSLSDTSKQTVLVEKTAEGQEVRLLDGEDSILCHTNHCYFGSLVDPPESTSTPLAFNSRDRLRVVARLAAQLPHACEGLKELLRDHTDPGGPCQHGGGGLHTDYAVVLSPSLNGIWLAAGAACQTPFQFFSVAR